MEILNKYKLSIIYKLLIIFSIINLNSCYYIQDVSPIDNYERSFVVGTKCSFYYYLLCVPEDLTETCNSLIFNNDSLIFSSNKVFTNGSSSIFYVSGGLSPGQYTITINNNLSIPLECIIPDLNSITLELKYKEYFNYADIPSMSMRIYGLYNSNLNSSIFSSLYGQSSLYAVQAYPFTNNYIFQTYSIDQTFTLTPSPSFSGYNGDKKQITVPPIAKDRFDEIFDIKIYPDLEYLNNSSMQLMGYNQGAIISFKINNTLISSTFFIITANGASSGATLFHPIYSDENSTTYLYPLKCNGLSTLYEIYYPNNGQFKKTTLFNVSIGQYQKSVIPATGFLNFYTDLINYGYTDYLVKDFDQVEISVEDESILMRFPYGVTFSDLNKYKYSINSVIKLAKKNGKTGIVNIKSNTDYSALDLTFNYKDTLFTYNNTLACKFNDFDFINLIGDTNILRLNISCPYSLDYIEFNKIDRFYGKNALVSGNLINGIYEIIIDTSLYAILDVVDNYMGSTTFYSPIFFSTYPNIKTYGPPAFVRNFDINNIVNSSFLYNDLNVTNHRHYNVLYFNSTDFPKDDPNKVIAMVFTDASTINNVIYPFSPMKNFYLSKWNDTIKLFQIEFYVEANSQIGDFQFVLTVSNKVVYSQSLDEQLRIKYSNMDLRGPIFESINKTLQSNSGIDGINVNSSEIGWSIGIQDEINGFKYGYITIKGELDQSIYNITFNPNDIKKGDIFLGQYEFKINISYPCISQNYIISEVVLYDKLDRISYFSILPINSDKSSLVNPFINFLNDSSINKIFLTCSSSNADTTPPTISSFVTSLSLLETIDVSRTNRKVTFNFTGLDNESGLKRQQYPIVYLSASHNRILECKSNIINYNFKSVDYSCTIELPLNFGFPGGIILSVYGFINNNGIFNGFSTNDLAMLGFPYNITTVSQTNEPSITGNSKFRDVGGDLWIYGANLGSSTAHIKYYDGSLDVIPSNRSYTTAVLFQTTKPTNKSFEIFIKNQQSLVSNTIIITPIMYDWYIHTPEPTPEPTPTLIPTSTPAPTNEPQSCPGNPVCGGPKNGKCIQNQGCVCYSPWIGNDCLSQIVIVDPPVFNNGSNNKTESPSIEIIVPDIKNNTDGGGNNNNSTTVVTYKSLISLVSLREIDIYGEPITSFSIEDGWISRQLDNLTFAFYKSIDTASDNNSTTNITVILKWFKEETNITFANQELLMYPSTMKYTIEISNYQFKNKLNSLQLVMSALIQSNTTDNICSSREFGQTSSGDNSNYLKIKVENHSLYGRFIRRGIVDSTIRTVSNVLLDSDFNAILNSKSIQSYVGIQIPYYKESVIIDPDFSVLIDSYSASSICSNKSKLGTGKIIGIAVGSAAFFISVIVAIIYFIKKRSDQKKFEISLNNKMKQMDS